LVRCLVQLEGHMPTLKPNKKPSLILICVGIIAGLAVLIPMGDGLRYILLIIIIGLLFKAK
jgi:ammonia channel protein AmtB